MPQKGHLHILFNARSNIFESIILYPSAQHTFFESKMSSLSDFLFLVVIVFDGESWHEISIFLTETDVETSNIALF